jgi:hypothetical protein
MTEQSTQYRSRLLRVLAIVWIALISVVALVDRVAAWHLTRRVEGSIEYDRLIVQALEERLAALEHRVDTVQRAPRSVSEEAFTQARQTLDDRLNQIDTLVRAAAHTSDLLPLQERLGTLENQLARVRTTTRGPTTPTPALKTVHTEPPPPDPPFTVLGIESRGNKRVLSVAAAGAYSFDAVRLLEPGESYEDWQLESVDGEGAAFRVAGRLQRIAVP